MTLAPIPFGPIVASRHRVSKPVSIVEPEWDRSNGISRVVEISAQHQPHRIPGEWIGLDYERRLAGVSASEFR